MCRLLKIAITLWLVALLCSCASVSMVDTWRNPNLAAPRLQKVLVVSITKRDATRRVFEDMLASELGRHGVEAVPGYTMLAETGSPDWSAVDRAVRSSGAQAVLTVQTTKVEQQTTVQPSTVGTYPGYWYPPAFPAWDLPGYYGAMGYYGPSYVTTYDVATMQTNLFDAASGKLLWAATLQSSEPENVTAVGRDLAQKVVKSLAKEGLI